jgi:hypothetical protein
MDKKSKLILAISITSAALAVSAAAAASVIVCKKIYEKKYFSAN